jgi:hypothetical protein
MIVDVLMRSNAGYCPASVLKTTRHVRFIEFLVYVGVTGAIAMQNCRVGEPGTGPDAVSFNGENLRSLPVRDPIEIRSSSAGTRAWKNLSVLSDIRGCKAQPLG